jgi:galactokinase
MHVRRATHVITETERVDVFARRLESGSLKEAGALMVESHRSLSELFEVSTPAVDALVEHLVGLPSVFGARMTGGGFGGCVVALMEHGAVEPSQFAQAWAVEPSQGATVEP